jgi:hypothetical protein
MLLTQPASAPLNEPLTVTPE